MSSIRGRRARAFVAVLIDPNLNFRSRVGPRQLPDCAQSRQEYCSCPSHCHRVSGKSWIHRHHFIYVCYPVQPAARRGGLAERPTYRVNNAPPWTASRAVRGRGPCGARRHSRANQAVATSLPDLTSPLTPIQSQHNARFGGSSSRPRTQPKRITANPSSRSSLAPYPPLCCVYLPCGTPRS